MSSGRAGLLPPTAASAPSPASAASMISARDAAEAPPPAPRARRGRSRSAARRRARARRWSSARRAPRGRRRARASSAGAADHEALDAARRLTASPAAGVVAADDGAFGQRAHLLLDADGQGRVERPRDRPAAAARAHRPRRGGPQSVAVWLERDDGERRAGRRTPSPPDRHRAIARSGHPARDARAPAATATRSAPIADGSPAVTSTCIVYDDHCGIVR